MLKRVDCVMIRVDDVDAAKIRETGLAHVALLLSRTHVPMRAIGLQRLAADVEDFERCAVLETGTLKSQIKTTAAREQRQA